MVACATGLCRSTSQWAGRHRLNRGPATRDDVDDRAAVAARDANRRLTGKQYADSSTVAYAYETTTSRLKSIADALSQVKTYSYAKDDLLTGIAFTGASVSSRGRRTSRAFGGAFRCSTQPLLRA